MCGLGISAFGHRKEKCPHHKDGRKGRWWVKQEITPKFSDLETQLGPELRLLNKGVVK